MIVVADRDPFHLELVPVYALLARLRVTDLPGFAVDRSGDGAKLDHRRRLRLGRRSRRHPGLTAGYGVAFVPMAINPKHEWILRFPLVPPQYFSPPVEPWHAVSPKWRCLNAGPERRCPTLSIRERVGDHPH